MSVIAGLSFSIAMGVRATLVPVTVAAFAAILVESVAFERNKPSWLSAAASSVGLVLMVGCLGRFDPTLMWQGFVDGWRQMLTSSVPAPAEPGLEAVPMIVTWITAAAAAMLTLRTARPLGPIVPPVLAYTFGLTFGDQGSAAHQGVIAVGALVGTAGVMLMFRATYTVGGRSASVPVNTSNRRVAGGAAVIVTIGVVGVLVGAFVPFGSARDSFELRDVVDEPPELRTALNPVAFAHKALVERDKPAARTVFTVETDRDIEKARFRLLVLDTYDGKAWTSSAQFLKVANKMPSSPEVKVPTNKIHQRITVEDLNGYWLPMVDWPTQTHDNDLVFDRSSGMLAVPGGLARGRTFDIDSEEPKLAGDVSVPRTARFASGPVAQHYLDLPGTFTATMRAASADAAAASFQFQSAVELEAYLSKERGLQTAPSTSPRSGQSLADLDNLLTGASGGIGSPDQFAALYAVLGRAAGMPTRIAVGYGVPVGAGRHEVRTNDLQVWPEVLFEGIGWVGFDPVPGGQAKPDQKPPAGKPNLDDTLKSAGTPPANPTDVGPGQLAGPEPGDGGLPAVIRLAGIALAASVGVVIAWIVCLWAVRVARRRRRRGHTDARARIAGAWHQALDRLAETGLRDSRAMTASDVVREGMALVGPEVSQPLAALRTIVNQARYRSAEPTAQQAEQAWLLAAQFDQLWRRTLSFGDRLRLLVDPRSLLARR